MIRNWLISLFNHNKAALAVIGTTAGYAAVSSYLQNGPDWKAIATVAVAAAAGAAKSYLPSPPGSTDQAAPGATGK